MSKESKPHHNIKKLADLKGALLSVPYDMWEDLCRLLGVDEATITDLKNWKNRIEKWEFCLQEYMSFGSATWEHVMKVVSSSPINQVVTAKVIGRERGIEYYSAPFRLNQTITR